MLAAGSGTLTPCGSCDAPDRPGWFGKSAVLHEADELLIRAEIPHATVVLEEIARCWPAGTHEPPAEPIAYRNLALLWPNFAAQGAQRDCSWSSLWNTPHSYVSFAARYRQRQSQWSG